MFVKHVVVVAEVVLLYVHLQIWPYNSFNSADFRISQNFINVKYFSDFVEFDRFKNNIHTNFISELKAIGQRFLRIKKFDGNIIDLVYGNTSLLCLL